ncbi:hypothetical protein OBBRIDRAFT_807600 [Obba rivulosa]|uniref:Uncharacterized protein n=1 Tax=Obba rivulosa TaxID=1052685 RepID=A0A8E2DEW8_9APHY|nr:hypothetical protein OBBRIDRAFT_807600 [Obba rivulosa]
MPSLVAIISAIVGGCALVTILLFYAIWSIRHDQAEIQRQHLQQHMDHYTLQLFECNQRRAQQVNLVFTSPTQDCMKPPECIPYSYPPAPSTSSLPRPKPSHPRTPPLLYETCPFSNEWQFIANQVPKSLRPSHMAKPQAEWLVGQHHAAC